MSEFQSGQLHICKYCRCWTMQADEECYKNPKSNFMIKSASVKIMLSYDYSHFETSMSLENESGITTKDIDNARKECQRLCDKAVNQFKIAKAMAAKRSDGQYRMINFESECKRIESKLEGDRTLNEVAMLKQYKDENWREQFDYDYDYEDDFQIR